MRCSGSKHVPLPPFQPNLRSETGVARFEGLRPQYTGSGSARAGDVRKKDYVFVTLRIILPNFLTVRRTFLGAARFRSTSFNTLPNRYLETLKTLRAQRQVRWPV